MQTKGCLRDRGRRIVATLEQGVIRRRRARHGKSSLLRNPVSDKEYLGFGVFLLECQGDPSPYWLRFKQDCETHAAICQASLPLKANARAVIACEAV